MGVQKWDNKYISSWLAIVCDVLELDLRAFKKWTLQTICDTGGIMDNLIGFSEWTGIFEDEILKMVIEKQLRLL
jgi:hypothetical protein